MVNTQTARGKAQDRRKNAKTALPATKKNIAKWKKNPSNIDIKGIDTKPKKGQKKAIAVRKVVKKTDGAAYTRAKTQYQKMDNVSKYDILTKLPMNYKGTLSEASIRYLMTHPKYKPPKVMIDDDDVSYMSKSQWDRIKQSDKTIRNRKKYKILRISGVGTILTRVVVPR